MLHMWQLLASISTPAPAQDVRRGHLRGALNGMKREAGVLAGDGSAVLELGLGVDHAAVERRHLAPNLAGGGQWSSSSSSRLRR